MVLQGTHRSSWSDMNFFVFYCLSIYFYVVDFSVKEELYMIPRKIAIT